MVIFNQNHISTAKGAIIDLYGDRANLSKYMNSPWNKDEVLYIALFATRPKKIELASIREEYTAVLDMLRTSNINIICDNTEYHSKDTATYGLIFSKIFNKDTSLWKERGIYSYQGYKWMCGLRQDSFVRELNSRAIIDSGFLLKEKDINIVVVKDIDDAKKAFLDLKLSDTIFFDTEGSGLRPYAKDFLLYTLQFTGNKNKNTSYVFMYEHPKVKVTNEYKEFVSKCVDYVFSKRKTIIHNSSYDLLVLNRKFALDPYVTNNYDTMIIYHFLTNTYEKVSLSLKDICFKQGVAWDWDNDLSLYMKEYCSINKITQDAFKYEYFDLDTLVKYAGIDTIALSYLWDVMEEMSKNHIALDVIRKTWEDNWQPIMQSLYQVMINGLPFDLEGAKAELIKQENRLLEIEEEIALDPFVKNTENILNQIAWTKANQLYQDKVNEKLAQGKEFKGKAPDVNADSYLSINLNNKFNSASNHHRRLLFIDVLKFKPLGKTDSGEVKVSDDIIKQYSEERPELSILKLFSEKAKIEKELGTYIKPWIEIVENSIDGRLRSTFNPLNTSGRLRGTSPSLLNISKDGILKKLIKPKEKWSLILQLDYNGLEDRIGLLLHQDPVKMNMKQSGVEDLHAANAITISKAKKDGVLEHLDASVPDHLIKVKKEFPNNRQDAKALTFGIAFGCTWRSISHTYNVSEDIANAILDTYWNTFKGEADYIKQVEQEFVDKGYYIYFGNLPIITKGITLDKEDKLNASRIRTCFNGIYQSGAFLTLKALDKTMRLFKDKDIYCKPFLSVYDSIILETKAKDVIMVSDTIQKYMSEPFLDNQAFLLSSEAEIGLTYKPEKVLSGSIEDKKNIVKEVLGVK